MGVGCCQLLYVIEKIEGQWAFIEWGKDFFKIPKCLLPSSAQSGDKVKIEVHLHSDSGRLRRKRDVSIIVNGVE